MFFRSVTGYCAALIRFISNFPGDAVINPNLLNRSKIGSLFVFGLDIKAGLDYDAVFRHQILQSGFDFSEVKAAFVALAAFPLATHMDTFACIYRAV